MPRNKKHETDEDRRAQAAEDAAEETERQEQQQKDVATDPDENPDKIRFEPDANPVASETGSNGKQAVNDDGTSGAARPGKMTRR